MIQTFFHIVKKWENLTDHEAWVITKNKRSQVYRKWTLYTNNGENWEQGPLMMPSWTSFIA